MGNIILLLIYISTVIIASYISLKEDYEVYGEVTIGNLIITISSSLVFGWCMCIVHLVFKIEKLLKGKKTFLDYPVFKKEKK